MVVLSTLLTAHVVNLSWNQALRCLQKLSQTVDFFRSSKLSPYIAYDLCKWTQRTPSLHRHAVSLNFLYRAWIFLLVGPSVIYLVRNVSFIFRTKTTDSDYVNSKTLKTFFSSKIVIFIYWPTSVARHFLTVKLE